MMVALIPVACQTPPLPPFRLAAPQLLLLFSLQFFPLARFSQVITTFAATCIIICIHFQSVRQSDACSVSQLLSLSFSQLFSLSVCQSFSQLFPVVCLHYLLLRRLHTFDLPPPLARLDSIFFAYNSPASKRERYMYR